MELMKMNQKEIDTSGKSDGIIPRYMNLYEFYRDGIYSFQYVPGSRIDSITQIQSRFSVSRETAKLVLRMLVDDGLVISKVGKGSFVADLEQKQKYWGIIIPFVSAHIEVLLYHLKCIAEKNNRELKCFLDYNNADEEINLVGNLIHQGYEAIIVVPVFDESQTATFYSKLNSGASQVILANQTMAGSYDKYVIQSYDLGVKRAVEYLNKQTEGNFLFVRDDSLLGDNMVQDHMEDTFSGYVTHNAPNRKVLFVNSVRGLSVKWIQTQRISGVFCPNDMLAVKIIGRIKGWGLSIPDDIRIVSYGTTDLARFFTPAISSVDGHQQLMALKISDLITEPPKKGDVASWQHIIQPELIIRET
jgi:DNA-binding LacI/PurR family transcriptional regulator